MVNTPGRIQIRMSPDGKRTRTGRRGSNILYTNGESRGAGRRRTPEVDRGFDEIPISRLGAGRNLFWAVQRRTCTCFERTPKQSGGELDTRIMQWRFGFSFARDFSTRVSRGAGERVR